MAVTCGFFNALEHDRLYDAIQMSSIFDGIIRDGIFSTIGTSMAVTASGSGLVVNVGAGRAWFNHTWILNDTQYPVEAEAAEVVLDRIDALVIEINQSAEIRDCSIKFIKGTPSSRPVRPTMIHNAEVNQYALAYVSIRAGQTTIFQADITSVIGNDETPFVTGLLQQTSIESIVAQWQDEFYTYFNNFRSTTTSDFNTWMAARVAEYNAWYAAMEAEGQADLAEFDSWFQEMKDQLSEDAAGHLQAEIDALELSAEKGSVVIVTTSDDTLINHACTISQGSAQRNATFDINKKAIFESIPFVGDMNITATNGTLIASKNINIPYFGRYEYDLEFWEATLAISSSSTELYERPITIAKGGITVGTTSFDNTGHATFKVHEPGTYTITSTTTGGAVFTANVEVTAETSYPVDLGTPIGRTALPTDDIQLWLKCGGEYDVTYTTLAEVLADTELFARLCADSNACDYMARSTTWAKENGPAIPMMTSNTTPSGEVIATSSTNAYKAFDGVYGNVAEAALPRSVGSYIGYLFTENTPVRKVKFVSNYTDGNTYKIQGFDGTNWNDIITFTGNGPTSAADHIYSTQYIDLPLNTPSYSGYRIYTNSVTSSGGNSGIWELQFYTDADIATNSTAMQIVGMFDYCAEALISNETWCEALAESEYYESVLNGSNPVMTSATAPSGTVASSGTYSSTWQAYRSISHDFRENGWYAPENNQTGWLQYTFANPIVPKAFRVASTHLTDLLNKLTYVIKAKVDANSEWVTLVEAFVNDEQIVFKHIGNNTTAYTIFRIEAIIDSSVYPVYQANCGLFNILGVLPNTSEAEGITIHSAANDTIYYLDGSTPVTVAVTDANGKAVIDTEDLDPGTYTLYSTVAKNPDNLSNPYTKTIKINGNTTEIYVMPILSLYWWGYKSSNLEDATPANGWTMFEGGPSANPTYNTNSVTLGTSASSQNCAIATKNAILGSKVHAIGKKGSANSYLCIYRVASKTFTNRTDVVQFPADTNMNYVNNSKNMSDIYVALWEFNIQTSTGYALWYE